MTGWKYENLKNAFQLLMEKSDANFVEIFIEPVSGSSSFDLTVFAHSYIYVSTLERQSRRTQKSKYGCDILEKHFI